MRPAHKRWWRKRCDSTINAIECKRAHPKLLSLQGTRYRQHGARLLRGASTRAHLLGCCKHIHKVGGSATREASNICGCHWRASKPLGNVWHLERSSPTMEKHLSPPRWSSSMCQTAYRLQPHQRTILQQIARQNIMWRSWKKHCWGMQTSPYSADLQDFCISNTWRYTLPQE